MQDNLILRVSLLNSTQGVPPFLIDQIHSFLVPGLDSGSEEFGFLSLRIILVRTQEALVEQFLMVQEFVDHTAGQVLPLLDVADDLIHFAPVQVEVQLHSFIKNCLTSNSFSTISMSTSSIPKEECFLDSLFWYLKWLWDRMFFLLIKFDK